MAAKTRKIENTEVFIALWREEESLWNVTSPSYKNRNAKVKSTRVLMGKCNMEEAEVKRKINTLRSYYSKELAKCAKKSGAGTDKTNESKWSHFQSMRFLRDTIALRKTVSSLDNDKNNSSDEDSNQAVFKFEDKEDKEYENLEEEPEQENNIHRSTKQPLQKKKKIDNSKAKEDTMLNEAMAVLASKKEKTNNADLVFGQSIGLSLQEIPDKRIKEYVKVKIQELIFQSQFGLLDMPFQQITTSTPVIQRQTAPHNSQASYYSNSMPTPHVYK